MNALQRGPVLAALLALLLLGVWPSRAAQDTVFEPAAAFGLPPLKLPSDVVPDRLRVELGRKLFFDRRLSSNGTMSCAMCHVPEEG
ncbi:MAG: cytochrome c peroxidase, partial [Betaproteobacteria bacterium]